MRQVAARLAPVGHTMARTAQAQRRGRLQQRTGQLTNRGSAVVSQKIAVTTLSRLGDTVATPPTKAELLHEHAIRRFCNLWTRG
jgi:hypothetical protein